MDECGPQQPLTLSPDSPPEAPPLPAGCLDQLAAGAHDADTRPDWPARSWALLRQAGVLGWNVPRAFGGSERSLPEVLAGNELLASACLTTTFLLSQREAAVRRVLASGSRDWQDRLLPPLARGECFLTVGLSQLTTSRQHGAPALLATPDGSPETADTFTLEGEIPWVTGADGAQAILTGAVLPDGRQLLFVMPTTLPGVVIDPPLPLSALLGSRTTSIHCRGVQLQREALLAGPAEKVLGPVGGGGLETSCLALGLGGAAVESLSAESARRGELRNLADRFEEARRGLRARLHRLAREGGTAKETLELRVDCTQLALRATQAALAVAKGVGFVAPHPAGRWARQALFFLVWSCPRPAAEGILADLLPDESCS